MNNFGKTSKSPKNIKPYVGPTTNRELSQRVAHCLTRLDNVSISWSDHKHRASFLAYSEGQIMEINFKNIKDIGFITSHISSTLTYSEVKLSLLPEAVRLNDIIIPFQLSALEWHKYSTNPTVTITGSHFA